MRGVVSILAKLILFSVALEASAAGGDVNVFIGTSGLGHVTPAASCPFGMVQAGPDTSATSERFVADWAHTSGYQHEDCWLWRFSQTHLVGTGCPSFGDFGILPCVDGFDGTVHPARMLKTDERAEPGFYAVTIEENGWKIGCEVSALAHSASYRFSFPKGVGAKLLLDLDWGVAEVWRQGCWGRRVESCKCTFPSDGSAWLERKVWNWTGYHIGMAVEFSTPVKERRLVRKADGVRGEVYELDFGTPENGILEVRLGLSMKNAAAAANNLSAEMPRFDFCATKTRSSQCWKTALSCIELAPDVPVDMAENFKSALYRTMIQPNLISDIGELPRYSTFSLWDTFRAAHPLYTLIASERIPDFVNSFLDQYERQGYLPIWALGGNDNHCMIGHHSIPVIVDAYLKGVKGVDWNRAWAAVKDSLTVNHTAANEGTWGLLKEDWDILGSYGYYPFDLMRGENASQKVKGESVARLLECAYDDACAARFAEGLGRREDAAFFLRRSENWRNVFDSSTGFMRGKDSNGRWREPFDPYALGLGPWRENDYCEGNAWQYTWHVMHDPNGLIEALGGKDKATERLDRLFAERPPDQARDGDSHDVSGAMGQYVHGNEPSHHIAYFYSLLGKQERTAEIVRQVFETQYHPRPDGLCGNDDCGQMAAWYVFSALGFYPFDPCGGKYVLGVPQVSQATLRLSGGKTFTIIAKGLSRENRFVRKVTLNGCPLQKPVLRHEEILAGGELVFEMGREPGSGVVDGSGDGSAKTWLFPEWESETYVFLPGCAYNGNRDFERSEQKYPPKFDSARLGPSPQMIVTDIPKLEPDGSGVIEVTTGDLATPCAGFFFPKAKKGVLIFTEQDFAGINLGYTVRKGEFTVSCPPRRARRYRICRMAEADPDKDLKLPVGATFDPKCLVERFDAADIPAFYEKFFRLRKSFLKSERPVIGHGRALTAAVEDYMNRDCWNEEKGFWGAERHRKFTMGWIGGVSTGYAMLAVGSPESREKALRLPDYLVSLQTSSGFYRCNDHWICPDAKCPFSLMRKNCEALYFLLKYAELTSMKPAWDASARKAADAFVSLWRKSGDWGMLVDAEKGEIVMGGTANAGLAPGALVKAYARLGNQEYLKVAESGAKAYYDKFIARGVTYGGPGEALLAPDSESAMAVFESLVELADITRKPEWIERAKVAAHYLSSWVVSYRYRFPADSEFAKKGINTLGAVFANAQNKHASPGFATTSTAALKRLAELTGDAAYLELWQDVTDFMPQTVSTASRPIIARNGKPLESGWINERVNMSDWEGQEGVGGVFYGPCWCATAYLLTAASRIERPVIYVSPSGDDMDSGDEGHPLRTLPVALNRVRALRQMSAGDVHAEIRLDKGVYPITEALSLGPEDSHLRVIGVRGESVVRGGISLPQFRDCGNGIWAIDLSPDMLFEQLWVNGRRAVRAKTPNSGYLYMQEPLLCETDQVVGKVADLQCCGFVARPDDLKGLIGLTPTELSNVVIRTYHSWYTTTTAMRHVDEDGTVIGTSTRGRPYFSWRDYLPRYELENYRKALDAPGEWFLDVGAHRLFYIPRKGETVGATVAEVPLTERMLVVAGDRKSRRLVEDVRFEGVAFDLAGYNLPPEGGGGEQSAPEFDATVVLDGAEGISFDRCAFTRTGHYGLWFRRGCRHCALTRSLVEDLGAGAVRIGARNWTKDELPDGLTAFVRVEDCILRAGGRIVPSAIGVAIYHASDCTVAHNEIGDFFYSGISMGWTWGYAPTVCSRNRLNWNHIHDIGQGVLSDMGGVYTLGRSDGTEVIGNHIHDVYSYDYTGHGGSGLYTDEGSAGIRFESNLVHNVKTGGLHHHYGRDNLFKNNILAFSHEHMIRRLRDEDHLCFKLENNIIFWDNSTAAFFGQREKAFQVTNVMSRANVWWSTAGIATNAFFGDSWRKWQAGGQDAGSRIADPLFADVEHDDFRLRKDSPAFACGFREWNFSEAGVRGTSEWRAKAAERTCPHYVPPVVPPRFGGVRKVRTGFECAQVAETRIGPFDILPRGKGEMAFALVGRGNSRGGRCLEFRDRRDYRFGWEPHAFLECACSRGKLTVRMSLKVDARAKVISEFRDYGVTHGKQYARGPMICVGNGNLSLGGKSIEIPTDAWFEVEFAVNLDGSRPMGSVSVTTADGRFQTIANVPISGEFRQVTWFGFMSMAQENACWWLDDFSLNCTADN